MEKIKVGFRDIVACACTNSSLLFIANGRDEHDNWYSKIECPVCENNVVEINPPTCIDVWNKVNA